LRGAEPTSPPRLCGVACSRALLNVASEAIIEVLDCPRGLAQVLKGCGVEKGSCGRRGSSSGVEVRKSTTYPSRRPNFPSPSSSPRNHDSCPFLFHRCPKRRLPNTKTRICRVTLFVVGYKALDAAMLAFPVFVKRSVVGEGRM
jgi:hypothetical protein